MNLIKKNIHQKYKTEYPAFHGHHPMFLDMNYFAGDLNEYDPFKAIDCVENQPSCLDRSEQEMYKLIDAIHQDDEGAYFDNLVERDDFLLNLL